MGKRILCMGSINIDLTMYMDRMPAPGETVVTDNFQTYPGGKGGNQAATAARLGADVRYFTKLGTDDFSQELTRLQKEAGVDMSGVLYVPGATAGIAMIRVDAKGQNSISFTPGANVLLTPEDVRENAKVFDGCDFLLITMEIRPDTVYEAIRIAKQKGMTVILDPAPAPEDGVPEEIARLVDYTKPNETEAALLTGLPVENQEDARKALEALREKGFAHPIVTLADAGALTHLEGEVYEVTPLKVATIDSTAAGDIFLGAFAAALAREESYGDCLAYAKTAAALSTMKKGAQSSIPTPEEVRANLPKK